MSVDLEIPTKIRFPLRFARPALFGLLLFAASCRGGCEDRVSSVRGFVPDDATSAIELPAADDFRGPLTEFISGLGEPEGIFAIIEGRYGIDPSSTEGIRQSGFDPDVPMVAFETEQAAFFAAATSSRPDFDRVLRDRLSAAGFDPAEASGEGEGAIFRATAPEEVGLTPVTWGFVDNAVVIASATDADAAEAGLREILKRSPSGPSGLDGETFTAAMEPLDFGDNAAAGAVSIRALTTGAAWERAMSGSFGFIPDVADTLIASASQIAANVTLGTERIGLRARLVVSDLDTVQPWVASGEKRPAFGSVLVRDTSALVRLRVDLSRFRSMPALVLRGMLPSLSWDTIHPLLGELDLASEVIPFVDGDVGVAVFGLAEGIAPASLARVDSLRDALTAFEGAVVLAVQDVDALRAKWAARRERAESKGYTVNVVPGPKGDPEVVRLAHEKSGERIAVFFHQGLLIITSGSRSYVEVREVLEGQATPLTERVETAELKAIVDGAPMVAGVYLAFNRLSRELSERGAPPFFLRLLDSIFESGLSVRIEDGAIALRMEVVQ